MAKSKVSKPKQASKVGELYLPPDNIVSELMYVNGLYWYETNCCVDGHTSVFTSATPYTPAPCGSNPPPPKTPEPEEAMEGARDEYRFSDVGPEWMDFRATFTRADCACENCPDRGNGNAAAHRLKVRLSVLPGGSEANLQNVVIEIVKVKRNGASYFLAYEPRDTTGATDVRVTERYKGLKWRTAIEGRIHVLKIQLDATAELFPVFLVGPERVVMQNAVGAKQAKSKSAPSKKDAKKKSKTKR